MYQKHLKDIEKEIKAKHQPHIEGKEKIHKQIWLQIQHKRAYIADVKTIKTSKSEKDLQISFTNSAIRTLQEQHKEAKKAFDVWYLELAVKMKEEMKALLKQRFNYEIPISEV